MEFVQNHLKFFFKPSAEVRKKNTTAEVLVPKKNFDFYCVTHSVWEDVEVEPRIRKKMSKVKTVDTKIPVPVLEGSMEPNTCRSLMISHASWGRSLRSFHMEHM